MLAKIGIFFTFADINLIQLIVMNKKLIGLCMLLCSCLQCMAQNTFEKYFEKKTLRVDFALSGNAENYIQVDYYNDLASETPDLVYEGVWE